MIRTCIFGLSIYVLVLFSGCGASSPTLATIGDEKFTLKDFEDSYVKNSGGWDTCARSTMEERQKFLDLLLNFRLKVKEARAQGLEKDSAIISESDSYSISVAQSYMIEKDVVEPGVKQFYDRKKEDVRASHILIRIPPNKDTVALFERAMKIITEIPTAPFDSLALKYSEDPYAKTNLGDLGFFSSGKMVPEFEDACYSMKVDEYTKLPVRSRYGYHIIKLTGRQPSQGSVRISHILLRNNAFGGDTAATKDTAWMVYNKIKQGESFAEMVRKYSKDAQSIPNQGDIGYYERDRVPPNIAKVFFGLPVDSVSEPMQFNYGFHIFKVTDKKPLQSFEELHKDLKGSYQQLRYQAEFNSYVARLKAQYKVSVDSSAVSKFISSIDTTRIASSATWKDTLTTEIMIVPLIRCSGHPLTVKDFANRVITTDEFKSIVLNKTSIWNTIRKLEENIALEEHARLAPTRFPLLSQLLQEYKEGILLYRVEQDEVWQKILVNDSLLQDYYAAHKESYRWPVRVNFAEIYTRADSMAKKAYWKLQYGEDFGEVAQEYTNRQGYQEKKGVFGFQPFDASELSRKASTMATDSITPPFANQGGWSIIKALGQDSARMKTFDEAMPEVATAYQVVASGQREKEWLESLKKKFPVVINHEVLSEAFKRKRIEAQ